MNILNINKGLSPNFDKALFNGAFKAWFENVLKPTVSLSTFSRYEIDYRLRLKDSSLSQMRLSDIKSIHVQCFYNDLLKGHTVNTVRLVHKLLRMFFIYCVKADLIVKNPLLAVELPKNEDDSTTNTAISDAVIEKLLQAAQNDISRFIYTFAVFTGLRQGELLALLIRTLTLTKG